MKGFARTVLFWVSLGVLAIVVLKAVDPGQRGKQVVSFPELVTMVKEGKVADVTIRGNEGAILGTYKEAVNGRTQFESVGPTGDAAFNILEKNGIIPKYELPEKTPVWQQALLSWIPMLFLIAIFFLFIRQMNVGGGKAMSFGKSRARMLNESSKKFTFKDVAGADEAKHDLEEIVAFLKDPKKFTRLGGRIPKGVLMMGPPGTGKTLLAKAVAGEAGVPFFSISGSDFVEMFVGVGASRVRDLFEQGKKHAPCIIFIDEIDAVGRHRGAGLGGGHDEREQTLNQLLVEMDGFESNEGVILVAATNRPDVLDPALMRPGRFDRRIVVSNPDLKGREEILKVHTRKVPLDPKVDLMVLARGTPGFSGADLENLVNEGALVAARRDKKTVELVDLEDAKDKVLMGSERRSLMISETEKRTTAIHEAGHTLVGRVLPGTDPIHKVTIIPRGMALGVTQTLPQEDRVSMDRVKAENMISFLMGGRVAEEVVLNQRTTGAGNDIERATEIARKMVCEWGMSDKLGPLSFGKKEEQIFLGREISQHRDYSESTAQAIDGEIRLIVDQNYQRAKKIIQENIAALHRLSDALLQYETIDGNEVDQLIRGEALTRAKPEPKTDPKPEGGGAATPVMA